MAVKAGFNQFWRIRTEASFDVATPGGGAEWNIGGNGGGANGWMDLPVVRESDGLQPKAPPIYPSTASGSRAMDAALPIAGAYPAELGNLEFAVYPELIDRILQLIFGSGSAARAATAGVAAKSSVAFASLATLDTQPNSTEQLKFVIASSTAASAASINIIQSATIQETITIGTSGASVDGNYYSKGGYKGTTNAITFTVAGTVTSGMVVVSGIDKNTNVFTVQNTNVTGVVEQGGRNEAGASNSEFFPGIVIPTLVLSFDRSAPESVLMANATIHGQFPTAATAGTYQDDAAAYYRPFAGWTGAVEIDDVAYAEVVNAQITIQPNNSLYPTATGNQKHTGALEGEFEAFGTMNVLPADSSRWDDYQAATERKLELNFTSPHYIVDTTGYQLLLQMTQATLQDYTRNRQTFGQTSALGTALAFRAIYNTTDSGPLKATTVSRMPV